MKRYIKSSNTTPSKYIGGKLYDLPDSYWDDIDDDLRAERYEAQDKFVENFADNYIAYRPSSSDNKYLFYRNYPGLLYDISDGMAIKDGMDVVDQGNFIVLIGYYNNHQDIVCLYPVNSKKADELAEIIDNSDFDESDTIDAEISQYAWQGQGIQDVLQSWA